MLYCGEDTSKLPDRRRASTSRSMVELRLLRVSGSTMHSLGRRLESAYHRFNLSVCVSEILLAPRTTETSSKRQTTSSSSPRVLSFLMQTMSSPSFRTTPASTRPTMETTTATPRRALGVSEASNSTLVHSATGRSRARSAATATSPTRLAASSMKAGCTGNVWDGIFLATLSMTPGSSAT